MILTQEYLSENTTRRTGSDYYVLCPECGGDDCFIRGFAYCFNCSARFDLEEGSYTPREEIVYDIAQVREVYAKAAKRYAYCADLEFAKLRGLDESFVKIHQIGFCTEHVWKGVYPGAGLYRKDTGKPLLFDRMTFPYLYRGEVTDIRGRAAKRDLEPRYMSPATRASARGAIYPYNADVMDTALQYMAVIEGEIKTRVSNDIAEVPSIGLPGISCWRSGTATDVPAIIVFDNDADPRKRAITKQAVLRLAKKFRDPYAVVLPLLGEKKMGADDFILHPRGGVRFYRSLIESAMTISVYRGVYH